MKFSPLILIAGTVGAILLLIVVGPMIEASGGNAEQLIPRVLGLVFILLLIAAVLKRVFFRQR
jgi:hypothetical protein